MARVIIKIFLVTLHSSYEIAKHVPCFHRVIETRLEVWEDERCCGIEHEVSTAFSSSPKLPRVFL